MKSDLISKINLSPQAITITGIAGLGSVLVNRKLLRDVNPMIKYGSGILLGGTLTYYSKNKTIKQAGIGLVIANSVNWILDATQKMIVLLCLEVIFQHQTIC